MQKLNKKPSKAERQLKAVNHPSRRNVLGVFAESDELHSPIGLSKRLGIPLATLSYHVRVLAACGAIELMMTKPVRGSMQHFYRASPDFIELPWIRAVLSDGQADDQE